MRAIGLGIIGCGDAARRFHAPALRKVADIRTVCLYDPVPQNAHALGGLFPSARLAGSVDELLAHPEVEAVAIITPPATHYAIARSALLAGKHALVEKPLTLDLKQAEDLVALARESGLVGAVGFHLRNHRLVARAKALLQEHGIGRVRTAHTLWCARMRAMLGAPTWRDQHSEGASLLDDVGIHHVDLLRYLLDAEIREVRASISDNGPTGRHVRLALSTGTGASLDLAMVEGRFEWQDVEIVGERGRIQLSLYDAWGYEALTDQTPIFGLGARVRRMVSVIKEIPAGLMAQSRGGDLAECYVEQWRRFAIAVGGSGTPAADFSDGLAGLRVIRAAQDQSHLRSARNETSQEILLRPSVAAKTKEADHSSESSVYEPPNPDVRPPLSVVLASPDEFPTLRTILSFLGMQTVKHQIELILVAPEKSSFDVDESLVQGYWGLRIVRIPQIRSIAQANAAGVRAARGNVIALAEDHCFPAATWAEALLAAHQAPHAAVGPVVRNANPATWISWADFLAGYGPWMAEGSLRPVGFLPGHNTSYKREVLEDLGDDLETMLEAETVLHQRLAAQGCSLHIEPRAVVSHVNFALLDSWADAQFLNGRMFAGIRCQSWGIGKRLLYFVGSPAIPLVRTARSLDTLLRAPINNAMKTKTFFGLVFGMIVDGCGQMLGYAAGPGSARERLSRLEFHRFRHIPHNERETLFV